MRSVSAARVVLEPQLAAHADEMFGVLADAALYEYEDEPPASLEWLRERFARLESRRSADGSEQWLNWVVRERGPTHNGRLIGYVQATVRGSGSSGGSGSRAAIAYVLASAYWGRGLAREATRAMLGELVESYGVNAFSAVASRRNLRSIRLLERLGFELATAQLHAERGIATGEVLMTCAADRLRPFMEAC